MNRQRCAFVYPSRRRCSNTVTTKGLCDMHQDSVLDPAFDPEDWTTWPVPDHAVNSRHDDGRVRRVNEWGDGWVDGFDMALRMADHFHKTGEWSTTA